MVWGPTGLGKWIGECWSPALPEELKDMEKMEFKVGDKVRIKHDPEGYKTKGSWSRVRQGMVGQTHKITHHPSDIENAWVLDSEGCTYFWFESSLELVKKIKPQKQWEFQPGDKVRVKDTAEVRGWSEGDEAIGFEFIINPDISKEGWKDFIDGCPTSYIEQTNKYGVNYKKTDIELVKPKKKGFFSFLKLNLPDIDIPRLLKKPKITLEQEK